ncbi:hypothetical protein GCM10010402_37020 [Actinomadura luteofluorescens]
MTATGRSLRRSAALHTWPKPPPPKARSSRYRPAIRSPDSTQHPHHAYRENPSPWRDLTKKTTPRRNEGEPWDAKWPIVFGKI